MLVFKISGEEELVDMARRVAEEQEWSRWEKDPLTFYALTPQKREVGYRFKKFRTELQRRATDWVWRDVVAQNPKLEDVRAAQGLSTTRDITPKMLSSIKLHGEPHFIEIYVVGHNISGFDEIVMAAQVVNSKTDVASAYTITRNFMPRSGKILFNDITFSLPNPRHTSRKDYSDWRRGMCTAEDFKYQFVKFMVRDTYCLTHTSLRNAAAAYSLEVEKGCCPYRAVNEFYMFGTYRTDEDGFPAADYWKDRAEYAFNKELWKKQGGNAYNIVQQTLEYCITDVIVTSQLVSKLQSAYDTFLSVEANLPDARFNIFQRPTISSNSHAIFKQILYRSQNLEGGSLDKVLMAPSEQMYEYVRSSIRGGRCYPTYLGLLEQPLYVYDICGMYASALTHPFPAGRPLNPMDRAMAVHRYQRAMARSETLDYFDPELLPAIFTIDADPPDEHFLDVLPPFCSRKGGRLVWTNESLRGEVATSLDVITLHNRGWKVTIVPDDRSTVWPQWKCLAKEYVQLNIAAKEKADREKNQTMRSIAKLLSNALYGSFATKLDNKKTVFSDQLNMQEILTGQYTVKAASHIETDNYSAEIMPEFVVAYPPEAPEEEGSSDDETRGRVPFIPPRTQVRSADHVTYTYKPITFLDVEEEDICLFTLQKNSDSISNNRYPSQIASFVLAWTRAFVSEWAGFLYEEDKGIPLEVRKLKSVYGDTDSLFVTEAGHRLMETKGKHRLKKNGGPLVFDPEHPQLTWLVECETQCEKCKADAYSSQSVFLAPKLYALRDVTCPTCGHVGKGKLRAKGHATTQLSFDLLLSCYYADAQEGNEKFASSRVSLKRTLASTQAGVHPFTVVETALTRSLRPWKDKTLRALDGNRLAPYCNSHPNPRNTEVTWMELPWST
uniref:DNA polymerase n=1 Tax=Pipistrellus pipistrellus adenovirus TaxID=3140007 RepID=A0AAU6S543_9ADEN